MKFLTDQDVYQLTVDLLKNSGHDVITARELNLHTSPDQVLLAKANDLNRLLVTRDKDFGSLVFLRDKSFSGIILLRGEVSEINKIHATLTLLLETYKDKPSRLHNAFCVIEPDKYRIRNKTEDS